MKISPVVASITIVVVMFSAIAVVKNAQYQKEKEVAWSEAYPLKLSCDFRTPYQRLDTFSSIRSKATPDNAEYRAEAERARERADSVAAECKKVRDYEVKYNDTIERSTY